MSCCAFSAEFALATTDPHISEEQLLLASRAVNDRTRQTDFFIPSIHCEGCVQRIETTLSALPGVDQAWANLSTKCVSIRWQENQVPPPFIETLDRIGYHAHLTDIDNRNHTLTELIQALAVAGLAFSIVISSPIAVRAGAAPDVRTLLQWISALIACPVLICSGHVFFRSAWRSLRRSQVNIDVPVSIGAVLAFGLSLYNTISYGLHFYFDAPIAMLFFLLLGRMLSHMIKERANKAASKPNLASRDTIVARENTPPLAAFNTYPGYLPSKTSIRSSTRRIS